MKNIIHAPEPLWLRQQIEQLIAQQPDALRIQQILHRLIAAGYRPLVVGGTVRDMLVGRTVHDIDIEVHRCTLEQLQELLGQFGAVLLVGKTYGVLRLAGCSIDWSVPRRDRAGRHPQVSLEPFLSDQEAFARRDLTINAMAVELPTGQLVDPFHGFQDLQQGILRAPDPEFFIQDPLRFYRVIRFMGVLQMTVDPALSALCATMSLQEVASERIHTEIGLWLAQSAAVMPAIQWLASIDKLGIVLPGVEKLSAEHFARLLQWLDNAYVQALAPEQRFIVRAACMLYALGGSRERVLLQAITGTIAQQKLLKVSVRRLQQHEESLHLATEMPASLYKVLAYHCKPLSLAIFLPLYATVHNSSAEQLAAWLTGANDGGVLESPEVPLLSGNDLIGIVPPGPQLGQLLARAYERQLMGNYTKEELLTYLRSL